MKKIILGQLCPAAYESDYFNIVDKDWSAEWHKFFGEVVAEDPDVSSKRIQLFIDGLNEFEDTIAEEDFWPRIIQFIIQQKAFSMSSSTAEIIYFLKECRPVRFQFRVARTIHENLEEMGNEDVDEDELLKLQNRPRNYKNDVEEVGWDLEILFWFEKEDVENNEEFKNLPPKVLGELNDAPDYSLDVYLAINTTIKAIAQFLRPLNVEIDYGLILSQSDSYESLFLQDKKTGNIFFPDFMFFVALDFIRSQLFFLSSNFFVLLLYVFFHDFLSITLRVDRRMFTKTLQGAGYINTPGGLRESTRATKMFN